MNFCQLTDFELDQSAIKAAASERTALHLVLEHLAEVQKRKSFSPKYRSIHAYAVGELKYDNKSAWRRVNAMFLMTELPQIQSSIQNGELDLSKLVIVQNHFRNVNEASKKPAELSLFGLEECRPKLSKEEKLKVVQSVIGQTSRETIRSLLVKSDWPQFLSRQDQVKPFSQDLNEVKLSLLDSDLKLINELRDLLAHKLPNASMGEIISAALARAKKSIEDQKSRHIRPGAKRPIRSEPENRRTASTSLKRQVYKIASGECAICKSRKATEIDHILPWAKGGKTNFENLRLLCRACNQRESVKIFGVRRTNHKTESQCPKPSK